jgi:mRNA interferase HigB
MRIIALKTLREFWKKYPDSEQPLKAWYEKVLKAIWKSRQDLEEAFGNQVKIIKGNRARFKIKGNNYRLLIAIDYLRSWVFIKFVGTNAEYKKIDAERLM